MHPCAAQTLYKSLATKINYVSIVFKSKTQKGRNIFLKMVDIEHITVVKHSILSMICSTSSLSLLQTKTIKYFMMRIGVLVKPNPQFAESQFQ